MAALKTQKNKASVKEFLQAIPDEKKRKEKVNVNGAILCRKAINTHVSRESGYAA